MWQVRGPKTQAQWLDVTCAAYWNMGRLYVCRPSQPRPTPYSSANVRWHTVSALPNRPHRMRAAFVEAT